MAFGGHVWTVGEYHVALTILRRIIGVATRCGKGKRTTPPPGFDRGVENVACFVHCGSRSKLTGKTY